MVRIIPTKGILFACNDKFRVFFKVDPKNPQILPLVASGASAGMTSTFQVVMQFLEQQVIS